MDRFLRSRIARLALNEKRRGSAKTQLRLFLLLVLVLVRMIEGWEGDETTGLHEAGTNGTSLAAAGIISRGTALLDGNIGSTQDLLGLGSSVAAFFGVEVFLAVIEVGVEGIGGAQGDLKRLLIPGHDGFSIE